MKYTPRLPEENVNVTPVSLLREFFVLIFGVLAVLIIFYFLLGFAVALVIPKISPELENTLARKLISRFSTPDIPDEKAKTLQALSDSLEERCVKLPYSFILHIADSPQENALALPGGNIVVFSGLLEKAGSENELAFVLFHEMGHFVNRDHLKGLGRSLVFIVISSIFLGPDNQIGNFFMQGLQLSEMKFSREQETHADEFALNMLNCAYGDVNGASDFFRRIMKEEKPAGFFSKLYKTHPELEKRIAHLEEYGRSLNFSSSGELRPLPDGLRKQARPE